MKGLIMSRKYKEIYDDKFLESIPEKYREIFGNLELLDHKTIIDVDKVLKVFGIKMKWLIIDVPEIFEDKEKTILFGNKTQRRKMRRFNQAKGIGHSLIKNRDLSNLNSKQREIFEGIDNRFAESFAKDLLMPEKLLDEAIESAARFKGRKLEDISPDSVFYFVMDVMGVPFEPLMEQAIDKGFLVRK